MTGIERNSDYVKMSSYAPLFSLTDGAQWEHNMINFSPREALKTANYLVQSLYMKNLGTRILDVKGSGKKKVYYSATADERFVYVKLVNAGKRARKIELSLDEICLEKGGKTEGHAAFEGAQMQYIHSDNLQARNHLDFMGEPEYQVEIQQKKLRMEGSKIKMAMPGQTFGVIRVKLA